MDLNNLTRLNLATWNADGVRNKKQEISYFLKKHCIQIFLINATKLKPSDNFQIKGFHVVRKDRLYNKGGGVAILVSHTIPFKTLPDIQSSIENIGIEIANGPKIMSVYNKPSNKFRESCLENLLSTNNTLIAGDFNARFNSHANNANGRTLLKFLESNDECVLHQSSSPTHFPYNNSTPTTIDLLLAKSYPNISDLQSLPELPSNHNVVKFNIRGHFRDKTTKKIFDYSTTDWKEYRSILNSKIVINNNIDSVECLEQELSKFSEALIFARNRTTRTKLFYPYSESLPKEIIDLIKSRNRIRKLWQHFRDPQDKLDSDILNAKIKREIKIFKNQKWDNNLKKLKPTDGSLWKMSKLLRKTPNEIPTLTHNSTDYVTDEQKSELLATTFEEIHDIGHVDSDSDRAIISTVSEFLTLTPDRSEINKYLTNPTEINNIIRTLRPNKAPGLDDIDNKMIKNLTKKSIVQLTYIINSMIRLNHWPNKWKTALIIPIGKNGKEKHRPTNYRPISLLSTVSKLTEKVILRILTQTLRKSELHDPFQFGFKTKHNSTHQLTRIITDTIKAFNKNQTTAMLLLDIEKAFDRVWVHGLLYKMIKLKLPIFIIKLISSYLTNRTFKVKLDNSFSKEKSIKAGVPQGSVLGPKLFNIFIHDLPDFPNTKKALFADDTAIYAHSFSAIAATRLIQYHLNILMNYYETWKIRVNEKKTEMIIFSRKINDTKLVVPLKINKQPVTQKHTVKYLGMELDSRLNFKKHIEKIMGKAYGAKKSLYPLLRKNSKLNFQNKKLIYTTLIRPLMTYAAPAWCHLKPRPMSPLQKFQNKILRLILNKNIFTRISELHDSSEIEMVKDHINNISTKFYEKTSYVSDPVNEITATRFNNKNQNDKHVLPYEHLAIFNKVFIPYEQN